MKRRKTRTEKKNNVEIRVIKLWHKQNLLPVAILWSVMIKNFPLIVNHHEFSHLRRTCKKNHRHLTVKMNGSKVTKMTENLTFHRYRGMSSETDSFPRCVYLSCLPVCLFINPLGCVTRCTDNCSFIHKTSTFFISWFLSVLHKFHICGVYSFCSSV